MENKIKGKDECLSLRIPAEMKKTLKKRAIDLDITITDYLLKLFMEDLKKNA